MLKKRITAILLLLIMCVAMSVSSFALVPHKGYTYDNMGNAVGAPVAYTFETEINTVDYGVGGLNSAEDVFVDSDDNIYLLDSKNARVVIFDSDYDLVRIIGLPADASVPGGQITYKGENLTMTTPTGLFVYEYYGKKLLYITDTGNARVIRVDVLDELEKKDSVEAACGAIEADKVYNKPTISIIKENTAYKPSKIVVDRAERMHLICQTINRGVVKLNADGTFNSFYGAPEVSYTLYEKFWRLISSNEQLDKMEKFVATEYSNISMDPDGFVWVVTKTLSDVNVKDSMLTDYDDTDGRQAYAPVKKLNSYGTDITSRTGTFPPVGDISSLAISYEKSGSGVNVMAQLQKLIGISAFEDISVDEYGCYTIVDSQRNKIFMYDSDGNLLFQFGNDGNQFGTFKDPVAVATFGNDKIVVLDAYDASLMIFTPTDYGSSILSAVRAYQTGEYELSEEMWGEVLKMNSNNMMAYSGVGKSLYRNGNYKEAMEYFTISKNVEYYSKALEEYLNELIGSKFTFVFLGIIIILLGVWIFKLIKQFRQFLRNGVKKVM